MYCLVNFCCICFNNKENLQLLSTSDVENITYFMKLISCVPEMCFNEMNDQRLVCRTCCETMNAAYKFRQECLRSKTMLTDYISQLCEESNINGAVNVYLTDINKFNDIKKVYSTENNLEIKTERTELCENVDKETNVKEKEIHFEPEINSEHNPKSLKLTDYRPNYVQFENVFVKMECENTNFDERIEENFDSSLGNQNVINIDVSNNEVDLPAPEIKKEIEDQDEHLQESFNNILETSDGELVDMEIKIEKNYEYSLDSEICADDSTLNLNDIKIDIVDNDIGLINDEINIQYKSKDVDKCSKDDKVIPFKVEDEDTTDKDEFSCLKTEEKKIQNSLSSEISELEVCGTRKRKVKKDVKIHMVPKAHECNICERTFSTASNKYLHMRTHTGEKPHECNICRKSFSQSSNLTHHMRTHTLEKPHECNVCKKTFRQSGTLTQHMRTHTLEKPHECYVCMKKFNDPSNLRKHLRTHTLEKPHECNICKKTFSQSCHLSRHLRTHTEKPHECNVCKKTFNHPGTLTQHLRTHTLEKPYECNVCKKTFSRSNILTQHLRTHTLEKPYECKVCMRKFSVSSNLGRHLKSHTGEKS